MSNYYKSTITNRVFPEYVFQYLYIAYGQDFVNETIRKDTFIPLTEPPTVVDFLKQGDTALAYHRYRELFPRTPIKLALHITKQMELDMQRFKKGEFDGEAEEQ